MLSDPTFWVAVGFFGFIALVVYFKGPQLIGKALDERSDRIRAELDRAQKLREDAQALFAEYQRKQRDALREAEEIVAQARAEAERIARDAEADLAVALERRRALAESKIAQAEAAAVTEVRDVAINLAIAAAGNILKDELTGARAEALMEQSVTEVRGHLN